MTSPDCRAIAAALKALRRSGFRMRPPSRTCAAYTWAQPSLGGAPALTAEPRDDRWVLTSGKVDFPVVDGDEALAVLRALGAVRALPEPFEHLAVA